MDKEEFEKSVLNGLAVLLPEKRFIAMDINKLGRTYRGIITEGESGAIADLDNASEKHLHGEPLEEAITAIADFLTQPVKTEEYSFLNDWDAVKDKLFIRLSNAEWNKAALENVPHKRLLDLAITYHILIDADLESQSTSIVSHNMLKRWGIDTSELDEAAMVSAPKLFPAEIAHIRKYVWFPDSNAKMIVITNEKMVDGAAAILYPGVLDKLHQMLGDMFILFPSSIHELLAVPYKGESADDLKKMVRMINKTRVDEPDRLSDNVYLVRDSWIELM